MLSELIYHIASKTFWQASSSYSVVFQAAPPNDPQALPIFPDEERQGETVRPHLTI